MAVKRRTIKEPLHHRILGKSQVELDLVEDLTDELESALALDLIEYDDYQRCHDALAARREKALNALNKVNRRALSVPPPPTVEYRNSKANYRQAWKPWQVKLMLIITGIILFKLFCK